MFMFKWLIREIKSHPWQTAAILLSNSALVGLVFVAMSLMTVQAANSIALNQSASYDLVVEGALESQIAAIRKLSDINKVVAWQTSGAPNIGIIGGKSISVPVSGRIDSGNSSAPPVLPPTPPAAIYLFEKFKDMYHSPFASAKYSIGGLKPTEDSYPPMTITWPLAKTLGARLGDKISVSIGDVTTGSTTETFRLVSIEPLVEIPAVFVGETDKIRQWKDKIPVVHEYTA